MTKKAFSSHGITHRLRVIPNDNESGWLINASSMGGSALVNLSQSEAEELARMLLSTPKETS